MRFFDASNSHILNRVCKCGEHILCNYLLQSIGGMNMALIPYEPFRQLANMRREFDRFFTDFPVFGGDHQFGGIRIDIHETEQDIVATCDLPGLESKEDVELQIENNSLTISGSIKRTHEVQEEHMHRRERFFGRFHRTVALPCPVDQDNVKATYRNGVLEVVMPKLAKDQSKRINIDFH